MNRRIVVGFVVLTAFVILGVTEFVAPQAIGGNNGDSTAEKIRSLREKLKEASALVDAIEKELNRLPQSRKCPPGFINALRVDVKLKGQGMLQDRYLGFVVLVRVDEAKQKEVASLVKNNSLALRNVVCARLSQMSYRDLSQPGSQERVRGVVKTACEEVLFAGHQASLINDVLIEDYNIQ